MLKANRSEIAKRLCFSNNPTLQQWEVIENIDGPMRVIAGPGSGKTDTMINRIVYMVAECGIDPSTIFLSTFTKKAANELKEKLIGAFKKANVTADVNAMRIGTFHSLSYELLTQYCTEYLNYVIIDEFNHAYNIYKDWATYDSFVKRDGLYLLSNSILDDEGNFKKLRDMTPDEKAYYYWGVATNFINLYDKAVESEAIDDLANQNSRFLDLLLEEKQISKAGYQDQTLIDFCLNLAESIRIHQEQLKKDQQLCFADIQALLLQKLNTDKKAKNEICASIKHIIIDEYQDTNPIQEKLVKALSAQAQSVCVVGDDDQSIYRFRGATVDNLLHFDGHHMFPNAQTKYLTKNFRSKKEIIDFYNEYMYMDEKLEKQYEWQGQRLDKIIESKDPTDTSKSVFCINAKDSDELCEKIKDFIESFGEENYNKICILASSIVSEQVSKLIKYLRQSGIKVHAPEANLFFSRQEIQCVKQCLCNCLPGVEGKYKIAQALYDKDQDLKNWTDQKRKLIENFDDDEYNFLSKLFYELMQFKPFKDYLDSNNSIDLENCAPAGNLAIFAQMINDFESLGKVSHVWNNKRIFEMYLKFFNEYLVTKNRDKVTEFSLNGQITPKNHVSVMTIHASKGLEFPVVICASLDDKPFSCNNKLSSIMNRTFVRYMQASPSYINEDNLIGFDFRRKYYTCFSRAKDLLILATKVTKSIDSPSEGALSSNFKAIVSKQTKLTSLLENNINQDDISIVKDKVAKTSYSFTGDIKLYEDCPLRYKLFKVFGFKQASDIGLLFGTLVHESIEIIHNIYLDTAHIPHDEQIDLIVEKHFSLLQERAGQKLKFDWKRAAHQVKNYVHNNENLVKNIYKAEYPLSEDFGTFSINGTIDAVVVDDNHVELLDFKTGKVPEEGSSLRNKYEQQLRLYKHLYEQNKTNKKVQALYLYFPAANNDEGLKIQVDDSQESIDDVMNMFKATAQKIEAGEFNKKSTDPESCANCCMWFYCGFKS
ncbi:MAG: UvrD-helicase domain-containing protein [Coriobacteriales bacterium]|nr:UvrD-helicase domain-containing protein [Coriobacteriales bacterium]